MRILGFCDSACIFVHACHADFGFYAFPHVISCPFVMRIWEFCDSAYYFVSVAGNMGKVGLRPRHDPLCRLLAVQA